jgi:DNA polymerase-4
VGLTCSLGVATGKALAKMASDLRKPNGLVVVPVGEEAAFLAPLSIDKLRGVGEATERKLRALGVHTIGDLARMPAEFFAQRFGVHGRELHRLACGQDDSPVVPERQAKSIGRETTFLVDVVAREALERTLLELAEDVAQTLRRHEFLTRGVTLKVRYGDFTTKTRAATLAQATDLTAPIYEQACVLLRSFGPLRPLRLIGITAAALVPASARQFSLFDEPVEKQRKLDSIMDTVRARFGKQAIIRARLADAPDGEGEQPQG